MAAVIHTSSSKAAELIISESRVCDQPAEDIKDLLIVVASLGSMNLLHSILDKDANVNGKSEYLGSPLQAAVAQGQYRNVLLLLEQGADVNYVSGDDGDSGQDERIALRAASHRGYISIVQLLLKDK